ncbi:hypothetical protein OUZ56_010115 [Daphnia magna]|uniref:Uncharacterized protein n=1 Tax=Daphnia magna TaxID=35525 RepID=A0ABR0AHU2_9CRUS|nr:hypothetical protein OUZ56_010115 [Daphnia magna]
MGLFLPNNLIRASENIFQKLTNQVLSRDGGLMETGTRRQTSIAWPVLCDCIVTAGVSNFSDFNTSIGQRRLASSKERRLLFISQKFDTKDYTNYECQIWDTAVQFFYRALTSEVYFINWSKPYASVAILHAFGATQ